MCCNEIYCWKWKWQSVRMAMSNSSGNFSFIKFFGRYCWFYLVDCCFLMFIRILYCVNWLRACFCLGIFYYYFHLLLMITNLAHFFLQLFNSTDLFCSNLYRMTHDNSMYTFVCVCIDVRLMRARTHYGNLCNNFRNKTSKFIRSTSIPLDLCYRSPIFRNSIRKFFWINRTKRSPCQRLACTFSLLYYFFYFADDGNFLADLFVNNLWTGNRARNSLNNLIISLRR